MAGLQQCLFGIPGISAEDIMRDLKAPSLKLFIKDSEVPQEPSGQKIDDYLSSLTKKLEELKKSIIIAGKDKRGWEAKLQIATTAANGPKMAEARGVIAKFAAIQQSLQEEYTYLLQQKQNIISQTKSASYQRRLITTETEHLLQQHSKYISVLESMKKIASRQSVQQAVVVPVDAAVARHIKEETLRESFFVGITEALSKDRRAQFKNLKYITDAEYTSLLKSAITLPGDDPRHEEIVIWIRKKLQDSRINLDVRDVETDSELQEMVFEQVMVALGMGEMTTSEFEKFFLKRDPLDEQNRLIVLTGNVGEENRLPIFRELPIEESRAHFLAVIDGKARNEWFANNVASLQDLPDQLITKNFTAEDILKILQLHALHDIPRPFNPLDEAHNAALMASIRDLSSAGSDQYNIQEPDLTNYYFLLKLEKAIGRPIINSDEPYAFVLPQEFKSAYQAALEQLEQSAQPQQPEDDPIVALEEGGGNVQRAVDVVNVRPVLQRQPIEQLIREVSAELAGLDAKYSLHDQGLELGKTEVFDALNVRVQAALSSIAQVSARAVDDNSYVREMLALRVDLKQQIQVLSVDLHAISERRRLEAEESRRQADLARVREEAEKVIALERARVQEAEKNAALERVRIAEEQEIQRREEIARLQAAAVIAQQVQQRLDPEIARRQQIEQLIKTKDYTKAMTFFKDKTSLSRILCK